MAALPEHAYTSFPSPFPNVIAGLLPDICDVSIVQVHGFSVPWDRLGHIGTIRACETVVVSAQEVVRQVPGRRALLHRLRAHDLACAVEVLPAMRGYRHGPVAAVVAREEI